MNQLQSSVGQGKTYIVGAGVAGLLVADALIELSSSRSQTLPNIEIIDQAFSVGEKLTKGNGRSMTVSEGLVAAGATPAQLRAAFTTSVFEGGMLYPGFAPTEADRQAIIAYIKSMEADVEEQAQILAQQGMETDVNAAALLARDDALLRFGFANVELWQVFARKNPIIAAKSGLQMNEKFRIYEGATAKKRAIKEVESINRIGAEFGASSSARLISYREAIAIDPALKPYFLSRLDEAGNYQGAITMQPGGVIHGGLLVRELEQKLRQLGVTFSLGLKVCGIELDSDGRIVGLKVLKNGVETAIGSPKDRFICTTGCDRLLSQSGIFSEELFPIAGTSITIPVDEEAVRRGIPFSRKSWKQDGVGPLVISPTFSANDEFIAFIDALDPATFDPLAPEIRELEFFSAEFSESFVAQTFNPQTIDPRQPDFDPFCVGARAGSWELRIGGLKFYPGREEALDLDHSGVRWALHEQIKKAIEFMPELMSHVLQRSLPTVDTDGYQGDRVTAEDLLKLQPWTGARPMYDKGMAAVGAFCSNGYAIVGTGSWGMACGLGNAAIIAQLVNEIPQTELKVGNMKSHGIIDYLQRVLPSRLKRANGSCQSQIFESELV
ncbi:FAD-dependent oxidoreductase [Myxosarcina sp. GI1]|uniref:FAD-dependent oxidoreductase n=1 Tax=Myxosarcina sp. GI1 TaxID=1541065 RepID=UPI00055F0AA8|nr:FAD-dependent oxidoreductase [Myxosarcina sp. GI1]